MEKSKWMRKNEKKVKKRKDDCGQQWKENK